MTGMTTIKVSFETRNRLKAQAAAAHLSLGAHLERLADAADREARLDALRRAVSAASGADAGGWARETDEWDVTEWREADGA
ncbi:hypothetical protein [Georgenia yuyongxinii]